MVAQPLGDLLAAGVPAPMNRLALDARDPVGEGVVSFQHQPEQRASGEQGEDG